MIDKEKIKRVLRKGYTPQSANAKPSIAAVYDNTFKGLKEGNRLELFFELAESDEPILIAWGFLGIYQLMEGRTYLSIEHREHLNTIIQNILNDPRTITYYSGDIETIVSLREHHGLRISWLNPEFTFQPVFEYCKSIGTPDAVVGTLLESPLSKVKEDRVESLALRLGENLGDGQFSIKLNVITALDNIAGLVELKENDRILALFRRYLDELETDNSEEFAQSEPERKTISSKKKTLKEMIFLTAARHGLGLKEEILNFLRNLSKPFKGLSKIAGAFNEDSEFIQLFLDKLQEVNNPHLISNLLEAILVVKVRIPNWKEIVVQNVKQYQLNEPELMEELEQADAIDEELALSFLKEGEEWQFSFLRQFFLNDPAKFDEWPNLQREIKNWLELKPPVSTNEDMIKKFKDKKHFALRIVIDLERKELIEHCLDNYLRLGDKELKKTALFSVLKFGDDEIWIKLRREMEEDPEVKEHVTKFWNYLERRNWEYFY